MGPVDSNEEGLPATRLKESLAVVWRGRWIILGCALVLFVAGYIVTLKTPPVYESSAMILIDQRTGRAANPFADFADSRGEKLANELGILKTRGLAQKVADALLARQFLDSARKRILPILLADPHDQNGTRLATAPQIAGRAQKSMYFGSQRESDIIRMAAESSDPQEAAILANTYAQVYKDFVMQQSRSRSRSVREFLETRLDEQRGQLSKAEASVKSYMESTGLVSLDGESNRIVGELSSLEAKRNALNIEIESVEQRRKAIEAELPQRGSSIPGEVTQMSDSYIRLLQEQIAQLEVQRDMIVAQNDPAFLNQEINKNRLREIEGRISSLRGKLQTRTNEFIQSMVSGDQRSLEGDPLGTLRTLQRQQIEARIQLDGLRSQLSTLDGIIGDYERQFRSIPRQNIELARLQRERLGTEKLYSLVEEKYNEAAITEKSEFGNVEIIDEAIPSSSPVAPSMFNNLLAGFLFGCALGVAAAFLREKVDGRVHSPEQLKRRGFRSLAEIGVLDREMKAVMQSDGLPENVRKFDRVLWPIFSPMSFLAESYRHLRSVLLRKQLEQPLRLIMITSANPSEGKSTTICNLAISIAETERRVLLIDADLRRPSIHHLLGLSVENGLSDLLSKELEFEQAVHRNVIPFLDVVVAGRPLKTPSRVFGSHEMADFLKMVRLTYDWILVDAPPILVVNDAAVLSSLVDGTILTVSAGATRLEGLDRSAEFITSVGGTILGVVLNQFNPRSAYGAYYGSYRYGHYDSTHTYYRSGDDAHGKTTQL